MKTSLRLSGISLCILFTVFSCGPTDPPPPEPKFPLTSQFDHQVYWEWNELFKKLDRVATGYRPCPAPRALAYLGLSAYESVVPGMPFHKSLAPLFQGLNIPQAEPNVDYFWPACVSESYAYMLERFFPHLEVSPNPDAVAAFKEIALLRNSLHDQYAEGDVTFGALKRSEQFGRDVATAVFNWSKTDFMGHNVFLDPQPSSYFPPNDPGLWQPTPPNFDKAFFPQYGQVQTFAMAQGDLITSPPIPFSENPSSAFYAQAFETFQTVDIIKNPDPNQESWAYSQHWISEFWSDDNLYSTFSAGTRWISIADQMAANEELNLAVCAELYAKLGLALHDATVALWASKYYYNVERPISYIHRVFPPDYHIASEWSTLLNNPVNGSIGITPAYPSYPSAHAGFAGGAAKILSSFLENTPGYDDNYVFTDRSHQYETTFLGVPRVFSSITQMGEECAYSRIPLGVNYRYDCEVGYQLGEKAAQCVLELPWKK
ncbi:MAG: vanadium-dependent haloperoxidase [Saprospiraceae bacterium]|nr:vanadium-dependent haloperoxidase [Saprospiraceae bacterium]